MECLVIPAILATIALLLIIIVGKTSSNLAAILAIMIGMATLISIFIFPAIYLKGMDSVVRMESYYDTMISPNIVSSTNTTVTVSNAQAGIWQAGGITISDYNSYLASNRYWRSIFILGTATYPAPVKLKYAIVSNNQKQ